MALSFFIRNILLCHLKSFDSVYFNETRGKSYVSPSPYVGASYLDGACLVTLVASRVCSEHRLSSGDCRQPPLMGAPGMHARLVIGGRGAPGLGAALLWKLRFSQVHGHQRTAGLQLGGSSAEREGLEWDGSPVWAGECRGWSWQAGQSTGPFSLTCPCAGTGGKQVCVQTSKSGVSVSCSPPV